MPGLKVRPLGRVARIADAMLMPLMWVLTSFESPQRTHWWNNANLDREYRSELKPWYLISHPGIPCKRFEIACRIFPFLYGVFKHLPWIGLRNYIIIEPMDDPGGQSLDWHVGWVNEKVFGISRLVVRGKVRVLIGPEKVQFFGVRADNGEQLQLHPGGKGEIGKDRKHRKISLI